MHKLVKINKHLQRQGFSLIELIVAILLIALLSTAIMGSMNALLRGFRYNRDFSQALDEANQIINLLQNDMHSASTVQVEASPVSVQFLDENNTVIATYSLNGFTLNRNGQTLNSQSRMVALAPVLKNLPSPTNPDHLPLVDFYLVLSGPEEESPVNLAVTVSYTILKKDYDVIPQ